MAQTQDKKNPKHTEMVHYFSEWYLRTHKFAYAWTKAQASAGIDLLYSKLKEVLASMKDPEGNPYPTDPEDVFLFFQTFLSGMEGLKAQSYMMRAEPFYLCNQMNTIIALIMQNNSKAQKKAEAKTKASTGQTSMFTADDF